MHSKISMRLSRLLMIIIPSMLLMAGCGEGSGPKAIPGTPPQPLTGVLLDAPLGGVAWSTSGDLSGVTNALGEFQYLPFETITFSIGGVVLGTVQTAPIITPVELTGTGDPTAQATVNQLVFLQSLDSNADLSDGITISDSTTSMAMGITLDFTAADFAAQFAAIISMLAGPNAVVVSEADALNHFYDTYVELGGTDSLSFLFPGYPPVGGGVTYELVFADEFEQGTAPDTSKWTIETGYGPNNSGWGNNEWQLYTDSPDNVRVEDGNLVLEARCPTLPCGVRDGTVTSGKINTLDKFNFRYGKVIARIKPPVGEGAWPAFWSLGANHPQIGWPRSGEIDFMEMHNAFSDERTTHFTMHWCDDSVQAPQQCSFPDGWVFFTQNRSFPESLGDDFHVFEADWNSERITGSIDGIQYFSKAIDPATMEEFQRDFYMILNVAMGGTLGSNQQPPNGSETFPQTMLVDYVRVFQATGGPTEDTVIDFEDAADSYDFGLSGGFGGGAAAVVDNPQSDGINTSSQVGRMLKFSGEVFAGSLLALPTPIEITTGDVFTMKVWSPRPVMVLLKVEGQVESERNVAHSGSGWEELTFDFSAFTGTIEGLSFIFDLGIVGDAEGDPDNWTFYFDEITLPTGSAGNPGPTGPPPLDFENAPDTYNFGESGGFGGGAAQVLANPVSGGINTSAQVGRMLKFSGEVFAGSLLALPAPVEISAGTTYTMKVWSPRPVMVLLKFEGDTEAERNVPHTGSGWEELTFDFSSFSGSVQAYTFIFDLGIVGDAEGDPDNWTFYFDDITAIPPDDGGPGPGDPGDGLSSDFEGPPESYDFGPDGGFGGGAAAVVVNPVPGGINTSTQVGRMLKFAGEVFAGSLWALPSAVDVPMGSSFTMKVWSPRPVMVLFKLEGGPTEAEVELAHGGSGWEELTFDFPTFTGSISAITLIFDLGIVGDAEGDPDNWTFYFDDVTLVPPVDPGGGPAQIDLPITFDDPAVDYTVADFGEPVSAMTTLVADPEDGANIVASTNKFVGTPVWAGTTISTTAGLASAIPFTATATTIGIRVYSPDAGIPVRLKAEDSVGGSVGVETEAMTTVANQWETLIFDFANPVVDTPALDLGTSYTALSLFFNFGTDGDTAGDKTYLWDDVEFGAMAPVVDVTPPMLIVARIASSNSNPAYAIIGDEVTVTLAADEPIMAPTVMIGGALASTVTGSGTTWQASRVVTSADTEGVLPFSIEYSDESGNAGAPVSMSNNASNVLLDATQPTVVIMDAPASYATLNPFSVTFQFSEAVGGFGESGIQVTNGVASGIVAVDDDTYTANVTPNGSGAVAINVVSGAATDLAGNANPFAGSAIILSDSTPPILTVVSIASNNANPAFATTGDVVTVALTASEPILSPLVTIAGAPADSVTGAGTTWQATRTLLSTDSEGAIVFALAYVDLLGNLGTPVSTSTDATGVALDITAPAVTIQGAPATLTSLDPISVTVQFGELVMGFDSGDIQTTNGSASDFVAVDGDTYTATVTPDGSGDLMIGVAAGAASDPAGNVSQMAAGVTALLDSTAPVLTAVSIASNNANPALATSGNVVTVTLTASETITSPTVTIGGSAATSVTGAGDSWQASRPLTGADAEGALVFSIAYSDVLGNAGTPVSMSTDASGVAVDVTAPSVMILGAPATVSNLDPISITFQFSELVTGFDVSDIQAGNGTVGGVVAGDGITYTANVTPDGSGALTLGVAAGAASDPAGNVSQMAADVTVVTDTTPPTLTAVSIASNNANPALATSGNVVTVTLTASEAITSPTVTIGGAAATSVTGAGTAWQASRTLTGADADGALVFSIAYSDVLGNAGTPVSMPTDASGVAVDVTAPGVMILGAPATVSNLDPISITFQFSELVTGFDVSDIQATNGTVGGFVAVDGDTYTAVVTPGVGGSLILGVAAGAASDPTGNVSQMATGVTAPLDMTAPTLTAVSVASDNANPALATSGNVVTVTLTASETITSPTVTIGGAATSVTGAGTAWQASRTLTGADAEGTLVFSIAYSDVLGNTGAPVSMSTDASGVVVDVTAPSVMILGAPAIISNLNPINFTFQFNELVAGFDVSDIQATNGTVGGFVAVDGDTYTANVTPDGSGALTLGVAAGAASDPTGNVSQMAAGVTASLDMTAPTLTAVSIASDNANPALAKEGDVVTVTLAASETITPPTVTIGGAAATSVTGTGASWQASRTLTGTDADGTLVFSIAYSDLLGNAGTPGSMSTDMSAVVVDVMAPSVMILVDQNQMTFSNLDPISVTFQFSEPVTGFDVGDIQATNGTIGGFVAVDGDTYTANVTPSVGGDLILGVAAGAASDSTGNLSQMAANVTVALDTTPPTLTAVNIASNNANPALAKAGDVVTVTLTASEMITAPTVTIGGAAATTVTGAGTTWQASRALTGIDAGDPLVFSIAYSDLLGNPGTLVSTSTDTSAVVVDVTVPSVMILGAPVTFTSLDAISFTFQFSELVTGFDDSDIQVTFGAVTGFDAGDGITYTAQIAPNGLGDLTIGLGAGAAADPAGNLSQMATSVMVTNALDADAPLLTVISIASNNTNPGYAVTGDLVTIDMTANEPINAPIVMISGAAATMVTDVSMGAGTSWQASRAALATDAQGPIAFTINITDVGGNPGFQSTVTTDGSAVSFDITSPTLSINGAPVSVTAVDPIPVSFDFSEPVTGFEVGDITVTNGTAGGFATTPGDAARYTAAITPNGDGNVTISVAASVATDLAGNASQMAAAVTVVFDTTPPTLTVVSIASNNATNTGYAVTDDLVTINMTASEPINTPVVTISGAPAAVTGAGTSWQASRTALATDAEGQIAFVIDYTDVLGNAGVTVDDTTDASEVTFDITAPTLSIIGAPVATISLAPFPVSFEFSENVSGFVEGDITVANGTAGDFATTPGDAARYTANITPTGAANVTISVAASVATDLAGNANEVATDVTVVVDIMAPTLTAVNIVSNNANPALAKAGDVVTVTLTASEPINSPTVIISGTPADTVMDLSGGAGTSWQASRPLTGTDADGPLVFSIAYSDVLGNTGTPASMSTDASAVAVDVTAPGVVILGAPPTFSNLDPISVTFEFSEPVTGFNFSDIQVTNGTVGGFLADDGDTYTANVTPGIGGDLIIGVAADAASDPTGNLSLVAIPVTVARDTTPPILTAVSIVSSNANPALAKAGDVVTVTLTASEVITAPTVTIGGAAAATVTGAGTTWQASRTLTGMDAGDPLVFSITYSDVLGNIGTPVSMSTDNSGVAVDVMAPSVTIVAPDEFSNLNPISFTFQFSELVTGFVADDIDVMNGSVTGFDAGDGVTYTADIVPTGVDDLTVGVADSAASDPTGNLSQMATSVTVTNVVDTDAPLLTVVEISSDNANPGYAVTGNLVTINMTASEPINTPTVTISGVPATTVTDVSMGAGTSWQASRLAVATDAQDQQFVFTIDFSDSGGNPGAQTTVTTDGSTVIFDIIAPTLSINGAPVSVTSVDPFPVSFVFSEPVIGFEEGDITVANGTAGGFATTPGDAARYTAAITPNGVGDVTISVAASVATDLAGNASQMAADVSVVVDATAPTLTTVSIASDNATNTGYAVTGDLVTIEMTADEPIDAPTVMISGAPAGTVTEVIGSEGRSWQASRTALATDVEGPIAFEIDFVDALGNAGPTATATTDASEVIFDITAPTVLIGGVPMTLTSLDPIVAVTFNFDEELSGFEISDITVTNGAAGGFATVNAASYTADITPNGDGDLTISVAAGVATDAAGNGNAAASVTATLEPFWLLVWSDEFDGTALDGANWTARTDDADCPDPCIGGEQAYLAERVSVAGGMLTITAQDDTVRGGGGPSFSSGLIDTRGKMDFQYGRVEIRAKMPTVTGSEPSLWLAPVPAGLPPPLDGAYGPWPLSGEIDIVNAPDLDVNMVLEHTLRYGLPEPEETATTGTTTPFIPDGQFHDYAMEWEAGEIRWFVDGDHVVTQTDENWYAYYPQTDGVYDADGVFTAGTDPAPFDQSFYLVMNLAVNSGAGASFMEMLEIDYVKVYDCFDGDPLSGTGCSTGTGVMAIVPPATAPYTEMLEVYTDAPGLLDFERDAGPPATPGLLVTDTITSGGGMVVTTEPATTDPEGGFFWRVNIVAAGSDTGAVVMRPGVFDSATGYFDLTGGETAGEVLFDLRVNPATTAGTQISVGLDSDIGGSREVLDYTNDGVWQQYSVKIADLVTGTVFRGASINIANLLNAFVLEASGGTADLDLDNISLKVACRDANGCEATARLAPVLEEVLYSQNFEGTVDIPIPDGSTIGDDWDFFVNVFEDGTREFGYGPFAAPNGDQVCALVTDQGGEPQGGQQLSVYSDYNCCDAPFFPIGSPASGHQSPTGLGLVETNVFQERVIGEPGTDIVGKVVTFSFDAKRGNINSAPNDCGDPMDPDAPPAPPGGYTPPCDVTAIAFIKVLDGAFNEVGITTFNTTNLEIDWQRPSVSITILEEWDGFILQFGFQTTAGSYEPAGNFYDNVELVATPAAP